MKNKSNYVYPNNINFIISKFNFYNCTLFKHLLYTLNI